MQYEFYLNKTQTKKLFLLAVLIFKLFILVRHTTSFMADLERERFEEDIPERSVSELPLNARPAESLDRRYSLPGDLNKKVEKQKVKTRLSEGGKNLFSECI